jgi:quercetin dioxygenase-like cupin family protein
MAPPSDGWSNRLARHEAVRTLEERHMKSLAALILFLSVAGDTLGAQEPTVTSLLTRDLAGVPGKELEMITVEYAPGGSDPPHRHYSQVVVYVLQGSVVMQVGGKAPTTLTAGDTFYEGPDDVHVVARNASQSAPAKFLVFFVKGKGAPLKTASK